MIQKKTEKRAKKPSLAILILNYNSFFWLKNLLESLKSTYLLKPKYPVKVIVADNHSDQPLTTLKRQHKWVEWIDLPENNGFAAGNNAVLKSLNTTYCLLLNSDTQCTSHSNFDILVDFMEKNKQVGICTPRVNLTTGKLDLASHRGEPTPWASFTHFAGLERLFPKSPTFGQYHQTWANFDTIHQIDACSGAAMMVRLDALPQVGYLDEQFFMYAEDLDWCKRFREAGYSIVYHPGVSVIHHKYKSGIKSSTSRTALKTKFYFYDTMLAYYDKHYRANHPEWLRTMIRIVLFIKKGGF